MYGLRSSRIQPRKAHENGVVEQSHFRMKTAVEQALLLRGATDFVDEAAYLTFVRAVVDRTRNRAAAVRLAEERPHLRPLLRRPRSRSTRRFSAGYVSGARSGWAAVRIRCRRG